MKKLFLTITAGIILTGTCVWMAGCKKEATNKAETTETKAKNWELDHKAVEIRIKNFIGSTKSLSKTDSSIAIEDALWNVEAALNFTYCSGVPALLGVEKDTLVQTFVPVSAGMLSANAIAQWYLDLTVYVDKFLNKISNEQGRIKLIDIENITKTGDTEVTFKVNLLYGYEMSAKAEQACSFGQIDNWYWGFKLGRADGAYINKLDASDLLEYAMNRCGSDDGQPAGQGSGYYFTNVKMYEITRDDITNNPKYRNPNDIGNPDNVLDYLIFYNRESTNPTNFHKILNYSPNDEMNFYLNGLISLKSIIMEELCWPEGYDFAYYFIIDGRSSYSNPSVIWHIPQYHYGIEHPGVNPE